MHRWFNISQVMLCQWRGAWQLRPRIEFRDRLEETCCRSGRIYLAVVDEVFLDGNRAVVCLVGVTAEPVLEEIDVL